MKKAGKITVICGSMFAGKSEELIRRARRALYAKKCVQVFKPSVDKRYDESSVVSHLGRKHEAVPVKNAQELAANLDPKVEIALIEEVQFFDSEIVELCVALADRGVEVIVGGLDQDFRRQPFGPMPSLMAVADEVVKLRAICMNCGEDASHTYRAIDGKPAHWDDPILMIGAAEKYEARCRRCFKLRGGPKHRF